MYPIIKRFFDIVASLITVVVLSPLLIPISIGLKLTGEGYIWYFQERVGYNNRLFSIIKFATMLKDSPNMAGGLITTKKDPRLTPLGGFLRDTKINELPQILNILKGDMSVVGPRPLMKKSFETYPEEIQKIIYNVKPGLTGIGSIVFRDEEKLLTEIKNAGKDPWEFYKNTIYPFKGEVEKWYQNHQSFKTDLLCIFLTFWIIIFSDSKLIYKVFADLPKRQF
ncbi:MAG: sugar transferase [Saprospiraceae bacterium]|nr:sugar transferase [Saprospiraceae bacterium]MBK8372260.1 sugar transferase [Saprospiraceae bacterium]MBK8819937.1 sugar transferase [Saprospiraceae bacterium]